LLLPKQDGNALPNILFSAYYANLFFGVRQAAEIDCLKKAIDAIQSQDQREWALGALVCATSSCAYNYGGHFAQPKLDPHSPAKFAAQFSEMNAARAMSVFHEFHVRLTSLASESESTRYPVELVEGPWENALDQVEITLAEKPVCVYIDPPYTRDEYSRYYHVLETLIHYHYPEVSGKASIPKRGDLSRFASAFLSANPTLASRTIQSVITSCLARGWSCLWSYSDSGLVNVASVLQDLAPLAGSIELYTSSHTYKGQGGREQKNVVEIACLITPIDHARI
jgi:adenine-specific DNA-methyltransferase